MSKPQNEIRKLLHRASPARIAVVFIFICAMIPVSLTLRYYAFETVLLDDGALLPDIKPGSWSVFCKLPTCKSNLHKGDFALFRLHDGSQVVRQVIAEPGDKVKFTAAGFTSINNQEPFQIQNENVIIADREFEIPSIGDTLILDSLSDIEFDYALNYLKFQNTDFVTDAKLFLGNEELAIEVAGNTRIGSRPTSIREIHGLPWQELYLISHQVKRNLHSTQNVYFKRSAYHADEYVVTVETTSKDTTKSDTLECDSSNAQDTTEIAANDSSAIINDSTANDSLADTSIIADSTDNIGVETALKKEKRIGERIEKILIEDNCFYVLAPNAERAADSREIGYIPESQIIGKMLFSLDLQGIIKRLR